MIRTLAVTIMTGGFVFAVLHAGESNGVSLKLSQKEFLTLEPILVTVTADKTLIPSLPATPSIPTPASADNSAPTVGFAVKPTLKPRKGAKPLPLTPPANGKTTTQVYDLLEWFEFPGQGEFTVECVIQYQGKTHRSPAFSLTVRRAAKEDAEWGPVDRIHHIPWSNYATDAFCGDTFDVVKRWPDSKLAKYCHFWNGLHHQHKKEYDKAVASFQIVVEKYPGFVLTAHAQQGLVETKALQGAQSNK
ncbi:MAG: hypothetical protein L0Y72_15415 [Gemmataceae bacterium]|nr:hypothetical protein [Gemmataceae bacterium]MCI0740434.1 hypothetical protein [Gemmataceae bacterium]